MLRYTLLFLSRRRWLRRLMESSRAGRRLTRRFVAGDTLQDALEVMRAHQARGFAVTLDRLGENVTTEDEALGSRDAALLALDAIARNGLRSTISIKLTQFGLDLSTEFCARNVEAVVQRAANGGSAVEIDMEDSGYTSRTLAITEQMHARYGCVRGVVQAYLRRTEADVRRAIELHLPLRLCKGAYDEPPAVAFPSKHEVDAQYVKLAKLLLEEGANPALATHDEQVLDQLLRHLRTRHIAPDRFEFQMLYGVRRDLQERLTGQGYRVRLYVPYGTAWYPYFMRRLAERPANLMFLARNLLRA